MSSSDSDSSVDSSLFVAKTKTKFIRKKAKPKPQDSDDDSDSDSSSGTPPPPKKARVETLSSDEEDSDDDQPPQPRAQSPAAASAAPDVVEILSPDPPAQPSTRATRASSRGKARATVKPKAAPKKRAARKSKSPVPPPADDADLFASDDDEADLNASFDNPESKGEPVKLKVSGVVNGKVTTHVVTVYSEAKLELIVAAYAAASGLDRGSILGFSFDGDKLDLSLTPSSLEMEDDDMVDVTVAKGATPAAQVKLRTRVNGDDKTFKEWKISSRDPLQKLADALARMHKVSAGCVVMEFDGDVFKGGQCCEDLEIEDDDIVDVKIKK